MSGWSTFDDNQLRTNSDHRDPAVDRLLAKLHLHGFDVDIVKDHEVAVTVRKGRRRCVFTGPTTRDALQAACDWAGA